MEVQRLDIAGGSLPEGVRLRESPTRASLGLTTVEQLPGADATQQGGFRVSSFFDIFTELTFDGGKTWLPSRGPSHVELTAQPRAVSEQLDVFPPPGNFNTPAAQVITYPNGLLLRRILHPILIPPIIPRPWPCLTCPPEATEFDTPILFEVSTDGGRTFRTVETTSRVAVQVAPELATGDVRLFEAEMLRLDISAPGLPGSPAVLIRESPTKRSIGRTQVEAGVPGTAGSAVSSFFDIWTEVSLDGGKNWLPALGAAHVELQQ
jgi:hypothetical protein